MASVGSMIVGPLLSAYVSVFVFWAWLVPALAALLLLRWVVRPARTPERRAGGSPRASPFPDR